MYILNRTESSSVKIRATPYELWTGKKPNLEHVRVFGSDTFEHTPKQFTKKFDPCSKKKILVGYQSNSPNYRLYNPVTKQVSVSRDVLFNEQLQQTAPSVKSKVEAEIFLNVKPEEENGEREEEVETVSVKKRNS